MIKINVPNIPESSVRVTLGGLLYTFNFRYNTTTGKYYLTITYNNTTLVSSLKLVDGVLLLKKYSISEFNHGDLFVAKMKETDESVGKDNIGVGKAYELIYIPFEES